MDEPKETPKTQICCSGLFYAHFIGDDKPLVVFECCGCGRLWHQREDRRVVPYDTTLIPTLRHAK